MIPMLEEMRGCPAEPTPEECSAQARVADFNDEKAFACWYPQMGGYVGKAVIVPGPREESGGAGCFEVYVWHDGEFPFSENHYTGEEQSPIHLHHCSPRQFIEFGEWVQGLK